jgi:alanyl-tRNA synthetase
MVIVRESSSSQGVRRIEALTSVAALERLRERAAAADRLEGEVESLKAQMRKLERSGSPAAAANGREAGLVDSASDQGGIRVVAAVVGELDADALLAVSDRVKSRLAPAVVVLGSSSDGKAHLIASVDQPAVDRGLDAVELIRQIAPLVGGGGGGRPTMARAGGSEPEQLEAAIAAAQEAIRERLATPA